jgi:very-short-patch-repair endonuclease
MCGKHHTDAMRAQLSVSLQASSRAIAHRASIASPSRLQLRAAYRLFGEFPSVIIEAPFGRYRVDIYLPPPYHLGIEVDGVYWHRNRDSRLRDDYLLEAFGLPIVHLSEADLKTAGIT